MVPDTRVKLMKALLFSTLLLAAFGFSGCKKAEQAEATSEAAPGAEAAAPKTPPGADILPGAGDVRKALAAKDYDQAVGSLMAIQGAVVTAEQRTEWGNLFQEVREALQDASPTNPKAAQALATLRAVRSGR